MRLDIVMPAHNEEDRIDRTLRAYRAACPDDGVRFIVALDSCTDRTPEIVHAHAARGRPRALVRVPQARQGRRDRRDLRAVGRGARRLRGRRRRDAAARDAAAGRRRRPRGRRDRLAPPPRRAAARAPPARPRDHQRRLRRQRADADGPAVPRHAVRRQGAAPRRRPRRAAAARLARPAVRRRPARRRARARLARGRGPDGVDRPGGLAREHRRPTRAAWARRCCGCGCAARCAAQRRTRAHA